MKLVVAWMSLFLLMASACTETSGSTVVDPDFSARVDVERDKKHDVQGTDLEIELTSTGKAIYDDYEVSEVSVTFSGIGEDLDTFLEDSGQSTVEYGGYDITLNSVDVYGDPKSATFDITAAG